MATCKMNAFIFVFFFHRKQNATSKLRFRVHNVVARHTHNDRENHIRGKDNVKRIFTCVRGVLRRLCYLILNMKGEKNGVSFTFSLVVYCFSNYVR